MGESENVGNAGNIENIVKRFDTENAYTLLKKAAFYFVVGYAVLSFSSCFNSAHERGIADYMPAANYAQGDKR